MSGRSLPITGPFQFLAQGRTRRSSGGELFEVQHLAFIQYLARRRKPAVRGLLVQLGLLERSGRLFLGREPEHRAPELRQVGLGCRSLGLGGLFSANPLKYGRGRLPRWLWLFRNTRLFLRRLGLLFFCNNFFGGLRGFGPLPQFSELSLAGRQKERPAGLWVDARHALGHEIGQDGALDRVGGRHTIQGVQTAFLELGQSFGLGRLLPALRGCRSGPDGPRNLLGYLPVLAFPGLLERLCERLLLIGRQDPGAQRFLPVGHQRGLVGVLGRGDLIVRDLGFGAHQGGVVLSGDRQLPCPAIEIAGLGIDLRAFGASRGAHAAAQQGAQRTARDGRFEHPGPRLLSGDRLLGEVLGKLIETFLHELGGALDSSHLAGGLTALRDLADHGRCPLPADDPPAGRKLTDQGVQWGAGGAGHDGGRYTGGDRLIARHSISCSLVREPAGTQPAVRLVLHQGLFVDLVQRFANLLGVHAARNTALGNAARDHRCARCRPFRLLTSRCDRHALRNIPGR